MDLAPEDHIRAQAAIQRWVDSSISKTCNVPNEYTVDQVRELYEMMYDLGCKGGTIYRDGSRDEQVLNLADDKGKNEPAPVETDPVKQPESKAVQEAKARVRPTVLHGRTYRKHTPVGTAYITINANGGGDQQPFEIFINVAKVGSDVAADAEALGRLISLILRMPSPLTPYERVQDVIAQLRGIGSGQQRGFGKQRVMSLADAVAQALAEHIGFHPNADLPGLPDEDDDEYQTALSTLKGDICPECGNAAFMMVEGCKKCYSCGYSQC
jgi:ribonucleoside-diphosphate reductase alpha chain